MGEKVKFFEFDEHTIIASNNKEEALKLYEKDYDSEYEAVIEIPSDTVVAVKQSPNSYDGYFEIYLSGCIGRFDELPKVVDTENYDLDDE